MEKLKSTTATNATKPSATNAAPAAPTAARSPAQPAAPGSNSVASQPRAQQMTAVPTAVKPSGFAAPAPPSSTPIGKAVFYTPRW